MFSENSYGFRPKRSAHDVINKCREHLDENYKYVVDMDLEKYFETVKHDMLITRLSKTIQDGRVISLIHRYLNAGVMIKDKKEETTIGVPAGGNLSSILSNIMLHELDREVEKRGHRHVRYADDVMIFCRTSRGAERVKKSITNFIEGKLKLKVNKEKTVVAYATKVKFLGFGFYFSKGAKVRIHPKSLKKMKNQIRYLLNKSKGNVSNEECPIRLRRYIVGWVNYFKVADMRKILKQIDEWMRSKIRAPNMEAMEENKDKV